jgi:hypothetical protein
LIVLSLLLSARHRTCVVKGHGPLCTGGHWILRTVVSENKKVGVFLPAYGVRSFGCCEVDGLMIGLFAVASTLYVTVNFAPLRV